MVNVKENPLIKKSFTFKTPMIQFNTTKENLNLNENQGSLVVYPKSSRFSTLKAHIKVDDSLLPSANKTPLIIKINGAINNKPFEDDNKRSTIRSQTPFDFKSILKFQPVVVLERLETSSLETSYRKPPDKRRKKTEGKKLLSKNEVEIKHTPSKEKLPLFCSDKEFYPERTENENDGSDILHKVTKKKTLHYPYTKPLPKGRKKKIVSKGDESNLPKKFPQGEAKGQMKKKKEKPVELFRKDLISAMKIPDHEVLEQEDYWLMTDPWRKEWEQPVQVPVSPSSIPPATFREIRKKENWHFRLPKRYLKFEKDKYFNPDHHIIAAASELANSVCPYDLDTLDLQWLDLVNKHRHDLGLAALPGETMERLIYDFESQAEEYFKRAMKNEEVMRLAYDENVACDICRKIYTEDGNEIVFCESCNISVHQFCYGIVRIPQGSWLCHTCALGIRPSCVLCPNLGGAMKNIKDHRWVHVSCAIWIPEVEISRLNRIGSIIQIDQIPESRFTLACSICHIREGACIQCSVKSCKVAYHVTCGYNENLEMNYVLEDEDENKESFFESFCKKHCKIKKEKNDKDTAVEEKEKRIAELKANFFKYVTLSDTKEIVKLELDDADFLVNIVYNYWLLKRRSNFNNPLFHFESEEVKLNQVKEDNINVRKNTYKSLRSSLEKARNLAYMICTREKKKKAFYKTKKEIFEKQYEMLNSSFFNNKYDMEIIINSNHGSSIYDKMTFMYKDPPFAEKLMLDYLYGHLTDIKRDKYHKEKKSSRNEVIRKYCRKLKEGNMKNLEEKPNPRRHSSTSSSKSLIPSFNSPSNLSTNSSFPYCSFNYSSEDTSLSIASTSSVDSKKEPISFAQASIPKMEFEFSLMTQEKTPRNEKKDHARSLKIKTEPPCSPFEEDHFTNPPLIKEEPLSPLTMTSKSPFELNDIASPAVLKKEIPSPSFLSTYKSEQTSLSKFLPKESFGHIKQTTIEQFFKPLKRSP